MIFFCLGCRGGKRRGYPDPDAKPLSEIRQSGPTASTLYKQTDYELEFCIEINDEGCSANMSREIHVVVHLPVGERPVGLGVFGGELDESTQISGPPRPVSTLRYVFS